MALERLKGLRDNGSAVVGGWFLRKYIQRALGGKDWWQSWTAVGLILFETSQTFADTACEQGLFSWDQCETIETVLYKLGVALIALGIRRAKATS